MKRNVHIDGFHQGKTITRETILSYILALLFWNFASHTGKQWIRLDKISFIRPLNHIQNIEWWISFFNDMFRQIIFISISMYSRKATRVSRKRKDKRERETHAHRERELEKWERTHNRLVFIFNQLSRTEWTTCKNGLSWTICIMYSTWFVYRMWYSGNSANIIFELETKTYGTFCQYQTCVECI